ncbi:MAG: cyclic nucleotide-binding domain-containing protein [Acidobacteriota bacterium]
MADAGLIERLEELFGTIPRDELVWLADHGRLETFDEGIVVAPKGTRVDFFWIILSGHIAIRVDRGAGPRRIMEWRAGDIWGLLPYSRMKGPPGDSFSEETTRVLLIHQNDYPDMIHSCPIFTAHTVHIMLDRARTFNTSDLRRKNDISREACSRPGA